METYVQWERHPVRDCYHIFSDGTRVPALFETSEDKVYAMNLMAVLAHQYHLRVYCPVVMDTHFHNVVQGRQEDVFQFEFQMRRQIVLYFHRTGRPELVEDGIWIRHELIHDDVELMGKIIYAFRNPMDAGFSFLPEDYPWGAGRIFFHKEEVTTCRKVGDMTVRQRREWFRSRVDIPVEWLLDENGMILPKCYVDLAAVHRLFGSPKRYIAFLFVRKKDLIAQEEKDARAFLEMREDATLHAVADTESQKQFGMRISQLPQSERLQVARVLWQDRRTLSRKQLARAVRMDVALIEAVFH